MSRATLELEYLKVEPFLTVYREVEESLEIKEDVTRLEKRIVGLNRTIATLSDRFEEKVKEIEKFNQRLEDFFAEYEQPSSEVQLPEPSKGEILQAKEKS